MARLAFALFVLCLCFSSCSKEQHINEFKVTKINDGITPEMRKEARGAVSMLDVEMAKGQAARSVQQFIWVKPDAWTEQKASAMRMASFATPNNGDVSVSSARGNLLANVNRWRGQVGLEPQSEAEMLGEIKKISSAVGQFHAISIKKRMFASSSNLSKHIQHF